MRDPFTGDRVYLFTIKTTTLGATTGEPLQENTYTLWARDRTEAIYRAWDRDPYAHRFEDITEEVAITERTS